MDNDYTQITWPEVRKGDVLMHENGDRLTVRGVGERITVAGVSLGATSWQTLGFAPYRLMPEMPTVPGAYADKRGVHWLLNIEGGWCESGFGWQAAEDAAEFAPFTRLVPMPTEEQVREMSDLRGKIVGALNIEGAFCGICDREPGASLYCKECVLVLNGYADAVLAVLDDVRAEAWDEGYDHRTVEYRQYEEERVNPYRKAEQ